MDRLFACLGPRYRRQAIRVFSVSAAVIAAAYLFILTGPGEDTARFLDNVHWTAAYLGAALLAWIGVLAAKPEDVEARRWFAWGFASSFIGQAIWDLFQIWNLNLTPSPADPFYIALGPFCAIGLWSCLRNHITPGQRTMVLLDMTALSVTVLALTMALYLPKRGSVSPLALAVLVAYPVALLSAACIGVITVLTLRLKAGWDWILFLFSLFGTGALWMEWNSLQLDEALENGSFFNLLFSLVTLAAGAGAMLWRTRPATDPAWDRLCERILRMLPLVFVLIAMTSVVFARTMPDVPRLAQLIIGLGAVVVILLAMARQSLLLSERDRLLAIEHRMQESEGRYKTLFETAQEAIFLMEGVKFIDCNPTTLRMFGCSRDQIIGHSPLSFSPEIQPDGQRSEQKAVEKIAAAMAGRPQVFEWLHRRLDGTFFDVEVSLNRIDLDGPTLIQASVRDITGRKQSEEALHLSEEQFARAFEYAPIGKAILAPDGKWLKVNRAICNMLGYDAEELTSKSFQELTHPDDLQADLDLVADVIAGRLQTYELEKRYFHRSGKIVTVLLNVSLVRDARGTPLHFISQIQDITQRKQLEEQFLQAQKMEAIGRLSGGVAHDFNNILTVIQMQIALLGTGENLTLDQVESIQDIKKAAERAANLTRQLLAFSRRQPLHPVNLDLNETVSNMHRMLDRIVGEDIVMELHYTPTPALVRADAGMIEQILLNLVVNARDAMPQGGNVSVFVQDIEILPEPDPLPSQSRPGSFVRLTVRDTGGGIPPDILPRIFEPFFTTKEVGQGTGLGLATVHGIVQQHNGWIDVENEAGVGASFHIHLPRLESAAALAPSATRTAGGGTETLLFVEDEPALRLIVRRTLSQLGYRVLEASSGREALELWEKHRNDIKLVFTDLIMPDGMTGVELARTLLKHNPGLKLLYTSGYSADVVDKDFPLQEGFNFLGKPYVPHKLAQTIRARLDGK
jgi:two-component system cell cycle sensor histidine kinase/response regulator CckA